MEKTGSIKQVNTQDLSDALQREAQLEKTRMELLKALFNRRGLERLRAISDSEWQAAEARDTNSS